MPFTNIQLFSETKSVQKMLDLGADLILLDETEQIKFREGKLEILDIYNANNTRIGAASRKAYIQLGLITRAVHVFVFNEMGELFLQKRAANKDTYPGFYAPSVAGHVGLREVSAVSAQREMVEEIGINVPLLYLGTFKCFQPQNVVNQFYDFYMGISSQPLHVDKSEAENGKFYAWDEVMHKLDWNLFVPALQEEMKRFRGNIESELKRRKIM